METPPVTPADAFMITVTITALAAGLSILWILFLKLAHWLWFVIHKHIDTPEDEEIQDNIP